MTDEVLANRYRAQRVLGEGAMGRVLLVADQVTGQDVALKIIAMRRTRDDATGGVAVRSRPTAGAEKSLLQFKQEFRLMTQLRHPHCCAVYDYGEMADGSPYFTMEVVPGRGLDELVEEAQGRGAGLEPERVRTILAQLLLALGYVHQLGFVHGDLKSANVRIRPDGVVKLMDYGLMDYANRAHTGVRGTLPYVSPEVVRRAPVDRRSDLYALGALAFEMLTGQLPFVRSTVMELLRAHVQDQPLAPSKLVDGIPADLERVVLRLLAKEPIERFQSAYEVLAALGIDPPAGIGGKLLASPMHGREAETARLAMRLSEALDGRPGEALLVHGPQGVGKSRLVEEFRFNVQLAGLPLATGRAVEHGGLPYQAFVGLLRGMLPALRRSAPDVLAQHAPVLVKLLPDLGVAPAEEMDTPAKEKVRLQAAVTSVVGALTALTPVVAVLEDWQWADALSQELLGYLLRNAQGTPLMLVVVTRELPEPRPTWVEGVETLPVHPLDARGLRHMVAAMLGSEAVATGFVAQVAELGEGNPFYTERLLEHLVEDGVLAYEAGRWQTDVALDLNGLPRTIRALLLRKLGHMSGEAQRVARVGAVLGSGFDVDLISTVAGLPEEALFEAIAELEAHGVFARDDEGLYVFAQEPLPGYLYDTIPAAERAPLHLAAARALELRVAGRPLAEAPLGLVMAIAHHLLQTDATDDTIPYAYEAGVRNASLFASAEAERFLSQGLVLIRASNAPRWVRLRLDYLCALGNLFRTTGRATEAREMLTSAVRLAEALGEQLVLGRTLTSLAKSCQVLDDYQAAFEHAERSAAVCEAAGDAVGASRAYNSASRIVFFQGNPSAALSLAERSRELAEASGERGMIGMAYSFLGYLCVAADPDRLQTGIFNLTVALELLNAVGDRMGLNNAYSLLGNAQSVLGELLNARESFTQNLRLGQETGQHAEQAFARVNLAMVGLDLGEFAEAARQADAAADIATRLDQRYPLALARGMGACALAHLGDVGGGLRGLREALAICQEIKNKYGEATVRPLLIEVLLLCGQLDEAIAEAAALQALIAQTGNAEPQTRLDLLTAELLVRRGERVAARERLDAALAAARAAHAASLVARGNATAVLLLIRDERWPEAAMAAEQALAEARRLGMRGVATTLLGYQGEIAMAMGRPEACDCYLAMEQEARALGVPLLQALALFGRAAARPYDARATELVALARAQLEDIEASLPPQARSSFRAITEVERILGGDHIAFGLPRQVRRGSGPLGRLSPGMGPGGML